jgi:hypothetical protein
MQIIQAHHAQLRNSNPTWCNTVFSAIAVQKAGVVRHAVRDVGRQAFIVEVPRRHFHLIECASQFIVICSEDNLSVLG